MVCSFIQEEREREVGGVGTEKDEIMFLLLSSCACGENGLSGLGEW